MARVKKGTRVVPVCRSCRADLEVRALHWFCPKCQRFASTYAIRTYETHWTHRRDGADRRKAQPLERGR